MINIIAALIMVVCVLIVIELFRIQGKQSRTSDKNTPADTLKTKDRMPKSPPSYQNSNQPKADPLIPAESIQSKNQTQEQVDKELDESQVLSIRQAKMDRIHELNEKIGLALICEYLHKRQVGIDLPWSIAVELGENWEPWMQKALDKGFLIVSPSFESMELLKNDELKDILKQLGLKVSGKKSELVQRIKEHIKAHEFEKFNDECFYIRTLEGDLLCEEYAVHIRNQSYKKYGRAQDTLDLEMARIKSQEKYDDVSVNAVMTVFLSDGMENDLKLANDDNWSTWDSELRLYNNARSLYGWALETQDYDIVFRTIVLMWALSKTDAINVDPSEQLRETGQAINNDPNLRHYYGGFSQKANDLYERFNRSLSDRSDHDLNKLYLSLNIATRCYTALSEIYELLPNAKLPVRSELGADIFIWAKDIAYSS